MRLDYLTTKDRVPSELVSLFGRENSNLVWFNDDAALDDDNPRKSELGPARSLDSFLIAERELDAFGMVMAAARFNYAVRGTFSNTFLGEFPVRFSHALKLPDLPYGGGPQRILGVATHDEEEGVVIPLYAHKHNEDEIFLQVVTEIPDERKPKTPGVYRDIYGFDDAEIGYFDLPDRSVTKNIDVLREKLTERVRQFNPSTIVTVPQGANFDHNATYLVCDDIAEEYGINLIVGDSLQNTRLRPTFTMVFDPDHVEKFVRSFKPGGFAMNEAHSYSIQNLLLRGVGSCEPLNREIMYQIKDGLLRPEEQPRAYATEPKRLNAPYQIRHMTTLFDRKS